MIISHYVKTNYFSFYSISFQNRTEVTAREIKRTVLLYICLVTCSRPPSSLCQPWAWTEERWRKEKEKKELKFIVHISLHPNGIYLFIFYVNISSTAFCLRLFHSFSLRRSFDRYEWAWGMSSDREDDSEIKTNKLNSYIFHFIRYLHTLSILQWCLNTMWMCACVLDCALELKSGHFAYYKFSKHENDENRNYGLVSRSYQKIMQ